MQSMNTLRSNERRKYTMEQRQNGNKRDERKSVCVLKKEIERVGVYVLKRDIERVCVYVLKRESLCLRERHTPSKAIIRLLLVVLEEK